MESPTTELAIAEIWKLFKETDVKFKETDARFKETDARLDKRIAETDARLDQQSAKINAKIDQTTANLQKLEGLLGNQWGRLIEALVRPGVLALFQEWGHAVRHLHQRSTAQINGTHMEIDLTLVNEVEVIPVEVKSSLKVEDVDDFLVDLTKFTHFFPEYRSYHVYGAVAGLDVPRDVARYAYRRGLFVVSLTGDDLIQILNDEKFSPKDFGKRTL